MASVEINNVLKSYAGHAVLHGVSVKIPDGQFVVLVGPSGCGKSTLLRMIAGLEDISGGTISIGDKVVNDLPPKKRDISMVFQNYALYPHMTVAENMAFSMTLAKAPKAEKNERVAKAAEILGLTQLLDRYPRQLSGGQRQRVAMGRSIVRNPQVFLFDEPLSNLDAKLRVAMRAEIKALHQRLRTTTVYVTHDQVEAMTMADQIVVLNDGRVEQIGSPLELYDHPANLFVATFIGSPSMNIIDGVVTRNNGAPAVRTNDGTLLPVAPGFSAAEGKQVRYGLRPEHLRIPLSGKGIAASIDVVEPTGSETQVHLRIAGTPAVAVFRERISARPGEILFVEPDIAKVSLFDAETSQALHRR
ncbi:MULTISPECIES: sn-glycerol-3-phosphate ABC transporter ATP-binding protein UgpC [unclassified Mesorhizobium]|uniref:ABC transporter ATP-binding protein n=1 Tax=unclassified Mesorhizobium TaxID=325217 RepID=UPI0003CEBAA6|nr:MULTISPECIES: sn-glycerol-3-phosphate ABC transporter ATP-binding protein UgpC [unclassified Mesorhizobium]ESY07288.1 sugar ABC transporter ATP-binding protein [Mesorhizobium sp. LNJC399B00]ESY23282.1 sugar ABC transporter ATP-binding protein [Mesorhizobium sp. LNJC394B00]ESY51360.1 sugar ABC transporter ATP-binding protein [Mesorhizobium sp. LNJC374B00]ESY56684.1 sugar ABC transporter ATP-binding protein [Mesorhizobium sp. LNJC372A00]ESZ43562.1 sugar ABC transporter ATP-binding protein [Me